MLSEASGASMNLKLIGVALILGALAGCSQAAPQPQAETTAPSQSAQTSIQGVEQKSSSTPQTTASVAGEYEGDFDGAGAAVTISGSAPRYTVHLIVGGDGCSGGAIGPASASSSGVLTVRPTDPAAGACTITMTPTARGYSVAESGCSNLHGDTCAFSGQVHRKR